MYDLLIMEVILGGRKISFRAKIAKLESFILKELQDRSI